MFGDRVAFDRMTPIPTRPTVIPLASAAALPSDWEVTVRSPDKVSVAPFAT